MGQPVPVSAHDGIDVTLHDTLEVLRIGDVLNPLRQLRVPNEVVTSNDGSCFGCLIENLSR
jgi:hypothetical protein